MSVHYGHSGFLEDIIIIFGNNANISTWKENAFKFYKEFVLLMFFVNLKQIREPSGKKEPPLRECLYWIGL